MNNPKILQIGVGMMGGWVLQESLSIQPSFFLIDFDIVEERNVLHQNFSLQQSHVSKTKAMETNLWKEADYGDIEIQTAEINPIEDLDQLEKIVTEFQPNIVNICVDNVKSRKVFHKFFRSIYIPEYLFELGHNMSYGHIAVLVNKGNISNNYLQYNVAREGSCSNQQQLFAYMICKSLALIYGELLDSIYNGVNIPNYTIYDIHAGTIQQFNDIPNQTNDAQSETKEDNSNDNELSPEERRKADYRRRAIKAWAKKHSKYTKEQLSQIYSVGAKKMWRRRKQEVVNNER